MDLPFKKRLFYFFPVLFCFSLSFGSLFLSIIIISWVITSLFNFEKEKFATAFKQKDFLLMLLFFVMTCISAALSYNKMEAITAIEIKMSFFIFPYLFFCFEWPLQLLKRCVISFVSGSFFACILLLTRAAFYTFQGEEGRFFYTLFSVLIHPSYFAMYLILALIFVILFYREWFKGQKTIIYSSYFFTLIFIVSIFLCSSKMGLSGLFIGVPITLMYKWKIKLNLRSITILTMGMILTVCVAAKIFPGSFERLSSLGALSNKTIDKTSSESTTVRILIWEQALNIIKNNFLLGTGVGDANDKLYNAYKENGLTGALEHHLNAHSQYFQSFIGMGAIGFVILLFLTLGKMINAFWKKNFLLFVFSLLIILNFSVESMLQTAAGVLFFAFFFCLFNVTDSKKLLSA